MKHYYLVDRAVWEKFPKDQFLSSHWIPSDTDGKLFVVVQFAHEPAQDFWESIPGVEGLPHVVFGRSPVNTAHVAQLSKTVGAVEGDETLTLAQKAGKIHPMFRPERV